MAPLPTSAEDAFDFIQARCSEADKLWQRKDRAGIDLLLKTLPYLDQPLVRDLSLGSPTLAGRRLNIHLDLAAAYAMQGQATESLDFIRKVLAEKRLPDLADYFEHDKALDSLRGNPEFRRLIPSSGYTSSFGNLRS